MQIIFNENLQKNVGKNLPYDIQVVDSQYDQKVTYKMVHHKCSAYKFVGHSDQREKKIIKEEWKGKLKKQLKSSPYIHRKC